MVDVARLRHADHRVQEQIGLELLGGAQRQLDVSTVQRVAGLEGDDAPPPEAPEAFAQFGRGVPQLDVVVMGRQP